MHLEQGPAVKFVDDDVGYQAWLASNPAGYVLNAQRNPNAKYLPLHTATCHTIKDYRQHEGKPAFTGGSYIKICASHPEPLLDWIASLGAKNFTTLCSSCNPDLSAADQLAAQNLQLREEAERLIANPEALEEQLNAAPRKPDFYFGRTKIFNRSASVVAAALLRAKGKCESCSSDAPFLRAGGGQPYLEVHHKIPLARGGDDHPDNTEALCPNCHRQKHFG